MQKLAFIFSLTSLLRSDCRCRSMGGKDEKAVRQEPMEKSVPRRIVERKQGPQLKVKYKKKTMVMDVLISNNETE